jgi:hypothetical protein
MLDRMSCDILIVKPARFGRPISVVPRGSQLIVSPALSAAVGARSHSEATDVARLLFGAYGVVSRIHRCRSLAARRMPPPIVHALSTAYRPGAGAPISAQSAPDPAIFAY